MKRPRSSLPRSRRLAFVVIALSTAVSLVAVAQPKKPRPAPASAKKPADAREAGAAPMTTREERPPALATGSAKDAGAGGGAVLEARTVGDGGARVFRFGEVEVEGRLKSPQIVYFLRRVRAEFAAGDLGHRSFMRELSETRNEPGF